MLCFVLKKVPVRKKVLDKSVGSSYKLMDVFRDKQYTALIMPGISKMANTILFLSLGLVTFSDERGKAASPAAKIPHQNLQNIVFLERRS